MMKAGKLAYKLMLGLMLGVVTGCSNHHILPDTGPDIQEVYVRHIGGQKGMPARPPAQEEEDVRTDQAPADQPRQNLYRPVRDGAADLADYTRHAGNEVEQLFPLLPNPQIVIYIPPKINAKGRPIPGYTTATRMYDRDEYAMPGEWIADHPDAVATRKEARNAP